MVRYKARLWFWKNPEDLIEKVEVSGETEKFVCIDIGARTRREAKESSDCAYFDNKKDAKEWIVNKKMQIVSKLKTLLEDAEKDLKKAESIKDSE